jgi:hypothetical protein
LKPRDYATLAERILNLCGARAEKNGEHAASEPGALTEVSAGRRLAHSLR